MKYWVIIPPHHSGSRAAAMEFSNTVYDLGSPVSAGPLQVVQLAEELKLALEVQPNQEERDNLRAQLPPETAQALINWLQTGSVSTGSEMTNTLHVFASTFFKQFYKSVYKYCWIILLSLFY